MIKVNKPEEDSRMQELIKNGWSYLKEREAITKEFIFSNFVEAFGWMCKAAIESEKINHHPEWSNVYKSVTIVLTTHDVNGLSEKDFVLAKKFDTLS